MIVYETTKGRAYCADSLEMMKEIPSESVSLIFTSPPYALVYKKDYGNEDVDDYVEWFMRFVPEFKRILKDDGSLVVNIAGTWNKGSPSKSTYVYELILEMSKVLPLIQDFYWYNPAKMPAPAEWVNVLRIRVKDSVEHILWFGKTDRPKANNRNVLQEYSESHRRIMKNRKQIETHIHPSGHIRTPSFVNDNGGSIPSNMLCVSNSVSNDAYLNWCCENGKIIHPARFPKELPQFFIKFLTDVNDTVFDPFAGSNTTGWMAETLDRRWISCDQNRDYIEASHGRFLVENIKNHENYF